MSPFTILHMSDLHIAKDEDPALSRLRESLIEDVSASIKALNVKLDAAVLTGDVVNKGGSEISYKMAEDFCSHISSTFSLADNIVVVPGNHDIPRKRVVSLLKGANAFSTYYEDKNKYEEDWESLAIRFSLFDQFSNKVMGDKVLSSSYGGSIKEVETPYGLIQFILLNSSWATTGEDDYQKIFVGRWQMEDIKAKRENSRKPDLTMSQGTVP